MDKIEFLQSHENMEIYQKAFDIIETYFGSEEEDTKLAPSVDAQGQQFNFNPDQQQQPSQGFEFWTHDWTNEQRKKRKVVTLLSGFLRFFTFSWNIEIDNYI